MTSPVASSGARRYLVPLAPVGVGLAAVAVGLRGGFASALLVLALGFLLLVVALLWASVARLTDPEALEVVDALELAGASAEEEQKRAVLRALKDLEHERALGKVSDDDYAALSARYREEARELLRRVDALALAAERALGPEGEPAPAAGAAERPKRKRPARAEAKAVGAEQACPACGTSNDADARFCDACGASLRERRP